MSIASETIIDAEWTVVVEVAQTRAIVACDTHQEQERRAAEMRLYAGDVTRTIAALPLDRPWRITRQMREMVAAKLDAQREAEQKRGDAARRKWLLKVEQAARKVAASPCSPSRQNWYG